jgi:hypothetical protein
MVVLAASSQIHSPFLGVQSTMAYRVVLSARQPILSQRKKPWRKKEVIFGAQLQKEDNKISKLVKIEKKFQPKSMSNMRRPAYY